MRKAALLLAGPVAAILAVPVLGFGFAATTTTTAPAAASTCQPATSTDWAPEQTTNAGIITQTGKARGIPDQGIIVALAVAMQESTLYNLTYGDRDSLGLFQQRASWGTVEQRLNPEWSAGRFYDALVAVDGWEAMPVTVAAQTVRGRPTPTLTPATSNPPATYSPPWPAHRHRCRRGRRLPTLGPACRGRPTAVRVLNVARCAASTWGITDLLGVGYRAANSASDHPAGRAVDVMVAAWQTPGGNALGGQVAAWAMTLPGVTYVIWDAHIWSTDRPAEGWRPYRIPAARRTLTRYTATTYTSPQEDDPGDRRQGYCRRPQAHRTRHREDHQSRPGTSRRCRRTRPSRIRIEPPRMVRRASPTTTKANRPCPRRG